jgi:hypothetical protein
MRNGKIDVRFVLHNLDVSMIGERMNALFVMIQKFVNTTMLKETVSHAILKGIVSTLKEKIVARFVIWNSE